MNFYEKVNSLCIHCAFAVIMVKCICTCYAATKGVLYAAKQK